MIAALLKFMPSWAYGLLAIVALVAAILFGLHTIDARGYQRGESECHAAQIVEAARAEKINQANTDAQNRNLLQLSEQFIAAKATINAQNARLQEHAHAVSIQYRPQPGAALQPVPVWIVPGGWVCDYNRAIGYAVPGAAAAAGGDAAATCAADPFAASGVSAEQILRHHDDYGAYCQNLEHQVNVLLDDREFIERQQAAQSGANQ